MSSNPAEMTESEKELAQTSEVVMALCAKLAERLSQWADDVPVFPSGVDLAAFPLEVAGRPANLEVVPEEWARPVIGYVGGLHKHVDFDLLAELADARPDWSWVLIGPFQAPVDKLQGKANVHLLGPRPHEQLVHYLRTFDVCLVPYVKNVYTETVVPAKLNEYLAVGKPVVATDLPTIREFNDLHKVLIATENRAPKFLQAIEEALRLPNDAATVTHRREVAALCDWSIQMEAMSELINSKIKRGQAQR
jgi:glycosyltransferase involved in cell wall biosynthesis